MNTKQKIGRACMIVGILLILGALALLGYNQWDANRADKASQDALGKLEETLTETMEDKTKDEESVVQPELDPEQEMTVTDIDPATGLLTTSTEGNPPLDEGTSIYDLYADRAERMGDEPLYTYKSGNDWVTVTANEFLADVRAVAKGLIHYGLKKPYNRNIQ